MHPYGSVTLSWPDVKLEEEIVVYMGGYERDTPSTVLAFGFELQLQSLTTLAWTTVLAQTSWSQTSPGLTQNDHDTTFKLPVPMLTKAIRFQGKRADGDFGWFRLEEITVAGCTPPPSPPPPSPSPPPPPPLPPAWPPLPKTANELRISGRYTAISFNTNVDGVEPLQCVGVGDGKLTCSGELRATDFRTASGISLEELAQFAGMVPPSAPPPSPSPSQPPPPSQPLSPFDIADGQTCSPGYVPLASSWQACQTAAIFLGFTGDSIIDVGYWVMSDIGPQGCFKSAVNGRIHFNRGSGGAPNGDKIICMLPSPPPSPPSPLQPMSPPSPLQPPMPPGSCKVYEAPIFDASQVYFWITEQCAQCLYGVNTTASAYPVTGTVTRYGTNEIYQGGGQIWHDNINEISSGLCCKVGCNPDAPLAACEVGRADPFDESNTFADGDILTVADVVDTCPP